MPLPGLLAGAVPMALTVGMTAGGSDRDPGADRPPFPIDYALDVEAVQLYPVVRHKSGYIGGLTAADFTILDGDREVPVESFSSAPVALNVVFVVDVSQSMANDLKTVKEATGWFLDRLRPDDRAGLVAFHHEVEVEVELTTDHGRVEAAFADLRASGGTSIFGTVLYVLDSLPEDGARNVVVLFSDGQDSRGVGLSRTVDRALAKGVVLYSIYAPGTSFDQRSQRNLFVLAERTGGEAHIIASSKRLGAVFDEILVDLRAQYSLSFTPSPGPPGKRKIKVTTSDRRYKVRCRRSYVHGGE